MQSLIFNPGNLLSLKILSVLISRGRARHSDSEYVVFAEQGKGNDLLQANHNFEQMVKVALSSGVTEDDDNDGNHDKSLSFMLVDVQDSLTEQEGSFFHFEVPSGAHVTEKSSISLVEWYCSKLPCDKYYQLHPVYKISIVRIC